MGRCTCARCGAGLPANDHEASQRLAVIAGRASGRLWRVDGPWVWIDLCRRCARALAMFLESPTFAAAEGPSVLPARVDPARAPRGKRARALAESSAAAEGPDGPPERPTAA